MNTKRIFAAAVVAVGIAGMNIGTLVDAAAAQERGGPRPEGHRRGGAPAAKPAPHTSRVSPQIARPQARVVAPAPRHFAPRHVAPPPVVRHAAPAHRPHFTPPRRTWRPWGYGAAAVGTVILGSQLIRSRPSDAEACANDFESFDWETGTISNEDGDRVLCPYLE